MPASRTDGFLLIDKPAGRSSQDTVTAVRRALGARRAGHTGTLDPFATGLLVVLLGAATRVARFVPAAPKTYRATIRFGEETNTDDSTGEVTRRAPLPNDAVVASAMARLTGRIEQVPPSFSAKHVGGRRAYELAREGVAVALPPVTLDVYSWTVQHQDDAEWTVVITCGGGVYVRALVRDLGRLAESAAHLTALRRMRIGPFDVHDAIALEQLDANTRPRPTAEAVAGMPRVHLDETEVQLVRQGRAIASTIAGGAAVLLDPQDELVAIAERLEDRWQPRVVLADA